MDFASISIEGEKSYNSDVISVFEDGNISCFAVADGKETPSAAELAVNSVVNDFKNTGTITKTSVPDYFKNADEIIQNDELPLKASMSFLLTNGALAVWGSIGDCRIYLLKENMLYEITPDHSDAYTLFEAGELRYPKIRKHKLRYNLFRMLGKGYDATPFSSKPEMIKNGDAFLICSDGFWENIHELQIEKTLKRAKSAQDWLDRMVKIIEKNIHHKKYSRFRDSMSAITIII